MDYSEFAGGIEESCEIMSYDDQFPSGGHMPSYEDMEDLLGGVASMDIDSSSGGDFDMRLEEEGVEAAEAMLDLRDRVISDARYKLSIPRPSKVAIGSSMVLYFHSYDKEQNNVENYAEEDQAFEDLAFEVPNQGSNPSPRLLRNGLSVRCVANLVGISKVVLVGYGRNDWGVLSIFDLGCDQVEDTGVVSIRADLEVLHLMVFYVVQDLWTYRCDV